ncbi:MAG: hypothetical protein U1F54_20100 [Burkholderiales bacterium]
MATASALAAFAAYTHAQTLLDFAANRVVRKYQSASCEELWQRRGKAASPEEQGAVAYLKRNPAVRREFLDKIAGPVIDKMFECGMIP